MSGYALAAPLNVVPGYGQLAWFVVGTVVTIGTAAGVGYLIDRSRTQTNEADKEKAVPKVTTCESCRIRRYSAAVHAQGVDCGGTSQSTIGAPAITKPAPILVIEGLALSAATKVMLGKQQLKIRLEVIAKAEKYIARGPLVGGYRQQKSFPVLGVAGGVRYDVDTWGDGNSFVA